MQIVPVLERAATFLGTNSEAREAFAGALGAVRIADLPALIGIDGDAFAGIPDSVKGKTLNQVSLLDLIISGPAIMQVLQGYQPADADDPPKVVFCPRCRMAHHIMDFTK